MPSIIPVGRASGRVLILVLCMAALGVFGSCFYALPEWHRHVGHARSNADECRYALVMLSSLQMDPRGLAAFPDGGIPITLRQVSDVWVIDPQQRMARKVATIERPRWIGGDFTVAMTNWQSHGSRSSLYLRITGTEGGTSDTPWLMQHARIDFDRNALDRSTLVYTSAPRGSHAVRDFVNPPPEYGVMRIREEDDTLSIWTNRSPDWRARFRIDRQGGNILVLPPVPKRLAPPDTTFVRSMGGKVCPEHIQGIPSLTESRMAFGTPPVLEGVITRVEASCEGKPHPIVGDENDGDMEYFILLTAWVEGKWIGAERSKNLYDIPGEEVVFEALSASSEVLGSTSMGYSPSDYGTTLNCGMQMSPDQIARVTRVVARWDRTRNTR